MTSNAGASEQAKEAIGFGRDRRTGEDTAAIERTFTPEFRNRLDAVISFAPLPKAVIMRVVEKFVLQLEAQLMDRNVTIELSTKAAEWLADKDVDRSKLGAGNLGKVDAESGLYRSSRDIQQLNQGDVALLKGELWVGNENAGLVHRSPAVADKQPRLMLTLDFIS